jgi:cell wall assembly regulator SMI1
MPSQQQIDDFFAAAGANDLPRVKALLKNGVPIEARDIIQRTPLWTAAQAAAEDVFNFLVSKGARLDVRHPEHGWTPLGAAAHGSSPAHERIFRTLLGSPLGKDRTVVQGAFLAVCCRGNASMVQALIDAGADVKKREKAGGGYLLSAITDNPERDTVVPVLLAAGADATVRRPKSSYDSDDDKKLVGKTPLEIAEFRGYKSVAEALRSAGTTNVTKSPKPKPAKTLNEAWDRIEAWLKANAKSWKPLRRGATDVQIARAERVLGLNLPADVRESYRRHDGTDEGFFPDHAGDDVSWELLSLDRMLADAKMMRGLLDGGDFEGQKPKAGKGVQAVGWHSKWVPFAGNGGGDNWCIDLAPASSGTVGQVIYSSHEMEPRKVLAKSFQEWLSAFAVALEAREYRYEEGEGLVPQ